MLSRPKGISKRNGKSTGPRKHATPGTYFVSVNRVGAMLSRPKGISKRNGKSAGPRKHATPGSYFVSVP